MRVDAQHNRDRILEGAGEGAVRFEECVAPISLQVSRLVGDVATGADQDDLASAAVRPLLEVGADGLLG